MLQSNQLYAPSLPHETRQAKVKMLEELREKEEEEKQSRGEGVEERGEDEGKERWEED